MKKSFYLALACGTLSLLSVNAVEIVAHRGASYDAPENSVSSFKLGYQQGADADECDIYLTKDGKIVIMHDASTLRTGGVSNHIASSTLKELKKVSIGQWGKWSNSNFKDTVPTLEEVLPLIPDGKGLFIEIKSGPEILPELQRVLKKARKKPAQTTIIGFGYETVQQAKKMFPELQVLWLVGKDRKKGYLPVETMIGKTKAAGLDGLDLEQGFPIDKAFVDAVHNAGLKLYTWTVDDPAVARKEATAGVDGITTNRPEWLRQQLATNP